MKKYIIPILMLGLMLADFAKAQDTATSIHDNFIYITHARAYAGGTLSLSICMTNSVPIRGFQFSVYLPDGITPVINNKGRIAASLVKSRLDEDDEHTLTSSIQDDGSILCLCGSLYDENFLAGDGEIVKINIEVNKEMEEGDFPIILKNIKLTETDINKFYEVAETASTITIESYTTCINATGNGNSNVAKCYNIKGQQVTTPQRGINIINGKKVVVRTNLRPN